MTALPRPGADEFAPYYGGYIAEVPDGNILETLRDQLGPTVAMLQEIPEERETYRYAEGKWSVREVVGHLLDTEWLFAFRALTMAREDGVNLPGMDQDAWVATSRADDRPLADMCAEWVALRRAVIHMFASMNEAQGRRTGVASGNSFSVRSFAWIIAGHELWHRALIRERYLGDDG